jgi:hypothetical protein
MAAKIEADMSRICEKCRYIEDYDHVFMIDEVVDRQNEKHTDLGRSALTADEYKKEIIPVLQELQFIEMRTENTFKLSDKGKKHCEELEARRID